MNDARNKLRSMGGIMASSPQLMQAATQRFQAGGLAMTTAPMAPVRPAMQYNDVMRSQMEPPVVGPGRVAPPPVRPAGLPESPVFRGGRGPVLGAAEEEDVVAELMAQSGAFRGGRAPSPEPVDATPPPETVTETIRRLEQAPRKTPANERRLQELKDLQSQMEPDVESREANLPGTTVLEAPVDLGGLVPKRAQEDPAEAEKIAQDAMSVLLKTQQPAGGDGGDGEEAPAKSLEDYYKDARALISKVYGEEDDGVDNRMMDLAMIGLAIAAGQSPNALTNIAQGLLVGTQGMAQRREAERERERGLRTLALETAIAQQGAATEAEAEAARMDIEQQNRLELEREKARLRGDAAGGSGLNKINAASRLYREEIANIREGIPTGAVTVPKGVDQEEFIENLARSRVDRTLRLQVAQGLLSEEDYASIIAELGTTPSPEGAAVPTVTTQEEYDALPSGSQFMQNGQLRRKP